MSASAPAPAAVAASVSGSKRKEPSAKEVAQAALITKLFDAKNSATITRAQEMMQQQQPPQQQARKKVKQVQEESKQQPTALAAPVVAANPFVAAMDSMSGGSSSFPSARTANGAPSHPNTKSPCLDLFYALSRGYDAGALREALPKCWAENAQLTMQVLAHGRDCHGDGKGERLVTYHALLWLRMHKPRTYLANIASFLGLGYFKDLVHLVGMIDEASACCSAVSASARDAAALKALGPLGSSSFELHLMAEYLKTDWVSLKAWRNSKKAWTARSEAAREHAVQSEAIAEAQRLSAVSARANAARSDASFKATNKLDPSQAWFDLEDDVAEDEGDDDEAEDDEGWEEVSVVRAKLADANMTDGPATAPPGGAAVVVAAAESKMDESASASASAGGAVSVSVSSGAVEPAAHCFISLAAKWAPSERHAFSSQAKRLARILFGGDRKQSGFASKESMQTAMKKYRKMLGTLRSHICITEKLACAQRWDDINFNAVPSKCHQILKKSFAKHCGDRYSTYLASLKKGVAGVKINVTGLQPHELVSYYLQNGKLNDTVEQAWIALVEKTREAGTFASAVSVVDVSGSMSGQPMNVAIAMGLLVAELCEGPYKGRCLTFHSEPTWHLITGETLREKVECLKRASWGGNTNLVRTFDLILNTAVQLKIAQDMLPKTLFLFSDMQFDEACPSGSGKGWMQTNFQVVKGKFEKAGYKLPNIVFWNLNGKLDKEVPIQCDTVGCALMSGFSAGLLSVFLKQPLAEAPVLAESATAEEKAAAAEASPMHPLRIMLDSVEKYNVVVDENER